MAKDIQGSNVKETNRQSAVGASMMSPDELDALKKKLANPTVAGFNFTEEERIGFAPYWNPEAGAYFMAVPVGRDDRDPEFVRILFRALHDILCFRGPADAQEPVIVHAGEEFSTSVYYALKEPFDLYIDNCDFEVPLRVQALETVKTSNKRDVWRWKVATTPEVKKKLDAVRAKIRMALGSGKQPAGALPAAG